MTDPRQSDAVAVAAPAHGAPEPPLLSLTDVHKRYGGVHALRGAALTISRPGTVHGLMGENGSGKSTLLSILSGQQSPDQGSFELAGEPVAFRAPIEAIGRGIAMVSQETAVAPHLSVAENVLLGRRLVRGPTGIDWQRTNERASAVLARLGLDYDPTRRVVDLRPDERQMVEIARALSMDARVLILDEPTSSLTDDEVEGLLRCIRVLSGQGVATILVTHRLEEMLSIADEFTVLRDGRTVSAGPASEYDAERLVEAMTGQPAQAAVSVRSEAAPSGTAAALSVEDVVADGVDGVSLSVRAGEIVGLSGLVGAGRSELLEAIYGVRPLQGGRVDVEGEPLPPGPRGAIARGMGYVPPDRKGQGVVLTMSVAENLMMVTRAGHARLRPPDRAAERRDVDALQRQLRIRAASPDALVSTLSGGNQQKVALGKWLAFEPRVLLLDEPTRGVDVGSKREIHELLREAASRGMALLVSSSDSPELLELCDRIVVMFRGRVAASLDAADATEATVARYAGGHA